MCDRSNQVRKVLPAAVQRVPVHHAREGMAVGLSLSMWQLPARRQRELFQRCCQAVTLMACTLRFYFLHVESAS